MLSFSTTGLDVPMYSLASGMVQVIVKHNAKDIIVG
jgi:hypothetical protein